MWHPVGHTRPREPFSIISADPKYITETNAPGSWQLVLWPRAIREGKANLKSLKLTSSGQENESKSILHPWRMADVSDFPKDLKDRRSRSPSHLCSIHHASPQVNPGRGLWLSQAQLQLLAVVSLPQVCGERPLIWWNCSFLLLWEKRIRNT